MAPVVALERRELNPEWAMTTAEWVAHQERLHGPDWEALLDRYDAEQADRTFIGCVGSEPFDAAPDLTDFNQRCAEAYVPARAVAKE